MALSAAGKTGKCSSSFLGISYWLGISHMALPAAGEAGKCSPVLCSLSGSQNGVVTSVGSMKNWRMWCLAGISPEK